jgi:hypothetical protein
MQIPHLFCRYVTPDRQREAVGTDQTDGPSLLFGREQHPHDRMKPSISLAAQDIASLTDFFCWVHMAIIFVMVACA